MSAANEAFKKELRRVLGGCPKFDGQKASYVRWKKLVEMALKSVSASKFLLPAAARLSNRTVEDDDAVELLTTDYNQLIEINAIMLHGLCNLLPSDRQDQVMELPALTRAEVLHDVVVADGQRAAVEAAIPATTDGQAHVSAMMLFVYGQYEASTSAEQHALYAELEHLKMHDLDIETLLAELNRACSALEAIGQPVHQGKRYAVVMNAMPAWMKETVANIEASNKTYEQALGILRSRLRTEKAQRESRTVVSKSQLEAKKAEDNEEKIFLIQDKSFKPTCNHCHKKGHSEANCFELHPALRQEFEAKKARNESKYRHKQAQYHGGDSSSCGWCGRQGHRTDRCRDKKRHDNVVAESSESKAMQVVVHDQQRDEKLEMSVRVEDTAPALCRLQIDGGADVHATGDRSLLTNIQPITRTKIGGFVDGVDTYSNEMGIIQANCLVEGRKRQVNFNKVYFVPGMKGTLISQGILALKGAKFQGDACGPSERRDLQHKFVDKDGKVMFEATQPAGSKRVYLNLDEETSMKPVRIKSQPAQSAPAVRPGCDEPKPECVSGEDSRCVSHVARPTEDEAKKSPVQTQSVVCSVNKPEMGCDMKIPVNSCVAEGDSEVKLEAPRNDVPIVQLNTWHNRLGHLGEEALKHTLKGAGIRFTEKLSDAPCDACVLGKLKKADKRGLSLNVATEPLKRVCFDLSGRVPTPSLGKAEYFGVVVDQATAYVENVFVKTKDAFPDQVIKWLKYAQKQSGYTLYIVRCDNAGEHQKIFKWCEANQVKVETTVAGNSSQNGLGERMMQEMEVKGRTMLVQAGAPPSFWAFAVWLAGHLYNATSHKRTNWIPPVTALFKETPRLDLCRPFGCVVYVKIDGAPKLGAQAMIGAYLGPSIGKRGVRVWLPEQHKVVNVLHYKCDEQHFAWVEAGKHGNMRHLLRAFEQEHNESEGDEETADKPFPPPVQVSNEKKKSAQALPSVIVRAQPLPQPAQLPQAASQVQGENHPSGGVNEADLPVNEEPPQVQPDLELEEKHGDVSQPQFGAGGDHNSSPNLVLAESDQDAIVSSGPAALAAPVVPAWASKSRYNLRENRGVPSNEYEGWMGLLEVSEQEDTIKSCIKLAQADEQGEEFVPLNHQQALTSVNANKWIAAEQEELQTLKDKCSFVASVPPAGKTLLKSKWLYSVKRNEKHEVVKYKARFVACGYSQHYLEDYFQTKADVAATRSFRLLLAIAVTKSMVLTQMDVKSAFLNSDLHEDVWIRAPEGCGDTAWRLRKALYGLKQAAHNWRDLVDKVMRDLNLTPTNGDPAMYFSNDHDHLILLVIHVDDMLLATSTKNQRDLLVAELKKRWELKVELNPTWLLRMRITQEPEKGIIKIDQTAYLQDILARFNATEGRTSRVPVSAGVYLAACGQNEPSDLNDEQIKLYQAIVGSLMYAATHTRPDISYAVSHLGKFLHKPASRHFAAAKTLLDYIRATVHLGLVYRREPCKVGANRNIAVVGYSDSNFASDQDRHSVGAYLFTMDGNAISWAARRIKNLCISTEEAELTAASEATREAIALRSMCIQIGILNTNQPIVLNIDNSPAVAAINNPGYYGRLKHLDIGQKFCMEAHKNGVIKVEWCSTTKMLADALTKPLSGPQLDNFKTRVMKSNYCAQSREINSI